MGAFISGVDFRPFWLRLPGTEDQPQQGIFRLKFTLETRLWSES